MGGLGVTDTSCERDDRTIVSRIARWACSVPDAPAFTFLRSDGTVREALTFGELWARSMSLAHGLAELVVPGDRAILAFDSQRELIEAFVACQIAGIVAVPASL